MKRFIFNHWFKLWFLVAAVVIVAVV